MGLFGGNNNFLSQFLTVWRLEEQKKKERKCWVNRFVENKSTMGDGIELTSGTVKLMAMSSWRRRRSKIWRTVGEDPCWSSWVLQRCRRRKDGFGGCGMTRWRKSTKEGSIYRAKWAGAILTYLFAIFEGVQVDMVTVRTVIKGLYRRFDSKRSWFWRYFTVQDLLVGSSAVYSNGKVADEWVFRWFSLVCARDPGWGCFDLVINDRQEEIIVKRALLLERISEH